MSTYFYGYTISALKQIVRDLTGIYSTDLISDDMINGYLNQAYFELATMQQWPWKVGIEPLAALQDGDYPPFLPQSHKLLAYRAAAHVLETQADDSPRATEYNNLWTSMIGELYQNTLQANSTGVVTGYPSAVKLVRELIDIFDQTITDAYITQKLYDEINQLYASYTWPFSATDFFTAAANYTRVIAFGAASRLAATYGKDQGMVSSYLAEYEAILDQMKKDFLYGQISETPGSFKDLRNQVRGLIQDYSKDIPDTMLKAYLNEEYMNLCNERDWTWLETQEVKYIKTGQNRFQLEYKGSRRVQVMYAITNIVTSQTNLNKIRNQYVGDTIALENFDILFAIGLVNDINYKPVDGSPQVQIDGWNAGQGVRNSLVDYILAQIDALYAPYFTGNPVDSEPFWEGILATMFGYTPTSTSQALTDGKAAGQIVLNFFTEATLITPGDTSSPVYQRPDVLGQEVNSSKYVYDIDFAGNVVLSPPALTPFYLKLKYSILPDMLVNDNDEPMFDVRFRSILAYRAALRLLLFTKSDKNLIGIYQTQADNLFNAMMVHYQLDRSTDVFSINQNGLDVMKYIPYFRVS